MNKPIILVLIWLLTFTGSGFAAQPYKAGFVTQNTKTGFLVLAPDRGFVGNEEINAVFKQFKKEYPSSLAFIGRSYNGMDSEYSNYIERAISELIQQGVSDIVAFPLFFSSSNPILNKVKRHLPIHKSAEKVRWANPMSQSYLMSQVLLDRVVEISNVPQQEKLVVLGMGAVDEKSEKTIRRELEKLIAYVKTQKPFQETQVEVYYNRGAALHKLKNKEVDEAVIHVAARKGNTLLVPFFIGPKFSNMMSMTHWLGQKFDDLNLVYNQKAIFPHPNVLTWMKKTANDFIPIKKDEVGIVIMPHGATQPYNDAVEKTIEPLRKMYKIEMAYGMGDSGTIQHAVSKLEQQGIKKIVFVRMYSLSRQFRDKTDYILGIRDHLPEGWEGSTPKKIRTSAVIKSFGGYEEDILTAEILMERIKEVSKKPSEETIVLLAHGAKEDQDDIAWRNTMKINIDWIKKQFKTPFKGIVALTLREDWQGKREVALKEIRKVIEKESRSGKVLVIANRLYGSGPYSELLKGLDYQINKKGFAPHPNLTRWLENGIEKAIGTKISVAPPLAEIKGEKFSQVSPTVLIDQ
jgi:hypothetical protein|tara:strand:+ start:715 stop:2442 length:1728 start_codon:yes stop_codon:yes gene_type:complete